MRKGQKSVGIVIRRGAEQAAEVEEALRVALGQTLAAERVVVALLGAGVWVAALPPLPTEQAPEIEKHLAMLAELGQELMAEAEALQGGGIQRVRDAVAVRSRAEALRRLAGLDVILAL